MHGSRRAGETVAPEVRVEPPLRTRRALVSGTVSAQPLRAAAQAPTPSLRERINRFVRVGASAVVHRLRGSSTRATIETRWYSRNPNASLPAVAMLAEAAEERGEVVAAEDGVSAFDRICAAGTMIVAAGLAVAISIVIAPRLRNVDLQDYPQTSALIMQGATVYTTACAACHGSDLKGAVGQTAQGGPPPLDASGHAWLHSDVTLFRMVKYGIANCPNEAAAWPMPGFGDQLDDRSIRAVLAFIKSHWPADFRVVQDAFNDGESDTAETQEAVLCTPLCRTAEPDQPTPTGSTIAAR